MTPPKENGTATIRDVMTLQKTIYDEQLKTNRRISQLEIRVAAISSGIALVISIGFKLIFK